MNTDMASDSVKILLTPIINTIAKKHFKYELLTSDLPNRWTGPQHNHIDQSCKYIGFILPMAKDAKSRIVLIYPIIGYIHDNTYHRKEWLENNSDKPDFSNCQTVFYGDLLSIVPWDEFIQLNENKEGHVSGTGTRRIKGSWLDNLITEQKNSDELISFVDIPISIEEAKASFSHSDRYELIVKSSLDIQFPGVFTHNETIQVENKSYRPDFYAETRKYMLVLEYDENNHQNYNPEQEITRMNNIRDYMLEEYKLPTVIIRYGNKFQRWSDAQLFMDTVKKYYTDGNKKLPLPRGNAPVNMTPYSNTIVLVGYPSNAYRDLPDWKLCNLSAQSDLSV